MPSRLAAPPAAPTPAPGPASAPDGQHPRLRARRCVALRTNHDSHPTDQSRKLTRETTSPCPTLHQVEAVYDYFAEIPRIRFLLRGSGIESRTIQL